MVSFISDEKEKSASPQIPQQTPLAKSRTLKQLPSYETTYQPEPLKTKIQRLGAQSPSSHLASKDLRQSKEMEQ
jgi:hypothetical protein